MTEFKPWDHSGAVQRMAEFRQALHDADSPGFTDEQIAAMLGSYVLAVYQQHFQTSYPPEFHEMMTKQNIVSEMMIAEGA
jgi:hypothetical protein